MSPDEIFGRFRGTVKGGGNTKGNYNPADPGSILSTFQKRYSTARIDPSRQKRAGGLENLDEGQLSTLGYKSDQIEGSKVNKKKEDQKKQVDLVSALTKVVGSTGFNAGSPSKNQPQLSPQQLAQQSQVFKANEDPNQFGIGRGTNYNIQQRGLGTDASDLASTLFSNTVDTVKQYGKVVRNDKDADPTLRAAIREGNFGAFAKSIGGRGLGIAGEIAPIAKGASATYKGLKAAQVAGSVAKTALSSGVVQTAGEALQGRKVTPGSVATNVGAAGLGELGGAVVGKLGRTLKGADTAVSKVASSELSNVPTMKASKLTSYESVDPVQVKAAAPQVGRTDSIAPLTPVGTGDVKKSSLGRSVQQKAIDEKLTKTLGDSPEYKQVNMKDQARQATELIDVDEQQAIDVATGKRAAPQGVLPESVYVAVENKALKDGNVGLLRDLANSSRVGEATAMGQRIRALAERDPDSAVTRIREVSEARMERAGKQAKQNVQKVVNEIKQTHTKPGRQDWASFVSSIEC